MSSKKVFLVLLLLFTAGFFHYCGTTAVENQETNDTLSGDIEINKDAVTDISKADGITDILPSDDALGDAVLADNSEDIVLADITEDIVLPGDTELSDILLKDAYEDIISDTGEDIGPDGGGDGGGKDSGLSDIELTDTSGQTYSIAGRVTVNGGKPESGKNVYVMVFDKLPGEGVNPIAYTMTDSNNDYFIDGLAPGKYYVFAVYDIDGNGKPNPGEGDPYGYYPNNPVEIKNSSLTGINIDIRTIQLIVSSLYMQRQQSRNAYLMLLAAKVSDPKTGDVLTNATVTAIDPVSPQVYSLTYNPQTEQYEKQFNPYAQSPVLAREGNYQFTIQHPSYGSQPVKLEITHKPQNQLVTIIKPANNSTVKVDEDLVVEWKNPSETDTNMMIQLMYRSGNQMTEVYRDEDQPIPNPYVIDGSEISDVGMYLINVVSGRFALVKNGLSIEATSGTVIVNAQ